MIFHHISGFFALVDLTSYVSALHLSTMLLCIEKVSPATSPQATTKERNCCIMFKNSFQTCSAHTVLNACCIPVIWGVAILLQEVIFNQLGNFQGNFVCFSQGSLKWKRSISMLVSFFSASQHNRFICFIYLSGSNMRFLGPFLQLL